jgi:hypothetical protein
VTSGGLPQWTFEERFDCVLGKYLPEAPRTWACAAARVFAAELRARSASPHRLVALDLARAWGLDAPRADCIGNALDVIQVAIDVADNLADEDEDRALGRDVGGRYATIPRAFLICLPAALMSSVFALLAAEFSGAQFDLRRAAALLARTLAEMAEGQAATELSEKIRLASGKQGLLLCLPAWLTHDQQHPISLAELELWAMAFGRSWEHGERLRCRSSADARQAWNDARFDVERSWPKAHPFDDHGPLARQRLLAPMMC